MSDDTQDTGSMKENVLGKFNKIKSSVESFVSDVNVNDLKKSFNVLVKDAQKDFSKLVDKDLDKVKKKFAKEKDDMEKKAKKFLSEHQKQIDTLQSRVEKLLAKTGKMKAQAPAAAATMATKKKPTMKKVARAVKKVTKA